MLQVTVALPSGNKRKKLELEKSSKVGDLKRLVQNILGEHFLSLVTPEGHVLKYPGKSLEAAEVSDGDHLTAVVQQVRLASTAGAFALWSEGGDKIVTWGHKKVTSNCAAIQDTLGSVQLVQGTRLASPTSESRPTHPEFLAGAFAAILEDGSVVTWGSPDDGGDSSAVSDQLKNVQQVKGTNAAFAAILADGSVVTWGDPGSGGDSSEVKEKLHNVRQIGGTQHAFAAVLSDGSLVAWGDPMCGGEFKIRTRVIDMNAALSQMCG